MDIADMLIPLLVIAVSAFMVREYTESKAGLMGGAVMGVIVLYSVGLIGGWSILISVLGLASLFFGQRMRGGE